MIFVDFITAYPDTAITQKAKRYGSQWCHMWTNGTQDELHAFANSIGLARGYFQDIPGFPHYDLVPQKRELAVKNGATEISLRSWIKQQKAKVQAILAQ